MPSGLASKPPNRPPKSDPRRPPPSLPPAWYGPPIDQVPETGSPVIATANTPRIAEAVGPNEYASPRPVTAQIQLVSNFGRCCVADLLCSILAMPFLGRKPWFAAAFKPGQGPRISEGDGGMYS